MSWILGIKEKKKFQSLAFLNYIEKQSIYKIHLGSSIIFAGGLKDNILTNGKDYIICGIPIIKEGHQFKELNHYSIQKIINSKDLRNEISELNGHFVGAYLRNDEIYIFNDSLGTRDLHYINNEDFFAFSSNPYYLLLLNKSNDIDLNNFASRFILSVQFNQKSVFRDIERITAGGFIEIKNQLIDISSKSYVPKKNNIKPNEVFDILFELMNFRNRDTKLKLGLSGGLDSRLLLSILINKDLQNFELYTFGEESHIDYIIAKKISNKVNINLEHFNKISNLNRDFYHQINDFAFQISATSPISETLQKSYYSHMYKTNVLILDGGFGEILRRGLFNRLIFSKSDIISKNINNVFKRLISYNNRIFNSEIEIHLFEVVKNQISDEFNSLPKIEEIGFENWLDLLSIRTKLVNYTGLEQARTDNIAKVFTPYQQKEIFDINFAIPISYRKNSKLFKDYIKKYTPELAKIPLAKGNNSHPFFFNTISSKIYNKLLDKFVKSYINYNQINILNFFKEEILDELNSDIFTNCNFYNHKLIKNNIIAYYNGDLSKSDFVDWFLSFHLFYKKIKITNNTLLK